MIKQIFRMRIQNEAKKATGNVELYFGSKLEKLK